MKWRRLAFTFISKTAPPRWPSPLRISHLEQDRLWRIQSLADFGLESRLQAFFGRNAA
jgi:hypothetical protein